MGPRVQRPPSPTSQEGCEPLARRWFPYHMQILNKDASPHYTRFFVKAKRDAYVNVLGGHMMGNLFTLLVFKAHRIAKKKKKKPGILRL